MIWAEVRVASTDALTPQRAAALTPPTRISLATPSKAADPFGWTGRSSPQPERMFPVTRCRPTIPSRPSGAPPRPPAPPTSPPTIRPREALLIPTIGAIQTVPQHWLRDLQALLDGDIEGLPVDGRDDDAAYVNERSLLDGLTDNPRASHLLGIPIAGPAVLCRFDPATGQQTPIPNDLAGAVLALSTATSPPG